MDLIERYLAAISRNLPAKQAGDITAELRDVLLSRVEDREATLSRPLTKVPMAIRKPSPSWPRRVFAGVSKLVNSNMPVLALGIPILATKSSRVQPGRSTSRMKALIRPPALG